MTGEHASTDAKTETEPVLLSEEREQVMVITLNRPKARNSLSLELMSALHATLRTIAESERIRAVVLTASGPAFCAGHDLKEMTAHRGDDDGGESHFREVMSACSALMQAIVTLPQPVIAAVHGVATAAGCQLVASCDLAVASRDARFATPGVDIGLFCSTPMVALSRNVAPKHAMELLLTGELVSSEHAQRIGLINSIVDPGLEIETACNLAEKIAQKSPQAVRMGKPAFHKQLSMSMEDAYAYCAEIMVENLMKNDAEEGICAFIEKRKPQWSDDR